jgi:hypothetical protein
VKVLVPVCVGVSQDKKVREQQLQAKIRTLSCERGQPWSVNANNSTTNVDPLLPIYSSLVDPLVVTRLESRVVLLPPSTYTYPQCDIISMAYCVVDMAHLPFVKCYVVFKSARKQNTSV